LDWLTVRNVVRIKMRVVSIVLTIAVVTACAPGGPSRKGVNSNGAIRLSASVNEPNRVAIGEFGAGAYRPGIGVVAPVLTRQVDPRYTLEARRAKLQGAVELEAVVLANGTVGDLHVTRSIDTVFGLDDAAKRAASQWTFKPGLVHGAPANVIVILELQFRMH
jgi:TonB family protein